MLKSTGADPGGAGAPGPLFLAKSILFFTLYTMFEKILKLNFDFIVAEIRGVFLEVWGCMRVCLCDPISLHDNSVVFLSNIRRFRNH